MKFSGHDFDALLVFSEQGFVYILQVRCWMFFSHWGHRQSTWGWMEHLWLDGKPEENELETPKILAPGSHPPQKPGQINFAAGQISWESKVPPPKATPPKK